LCADYGGRSDVASQAPGFAQQLRQFAKFVAICGAVATIFISPKWVEALTKGALGIRCAARGSDVALANVPVFPTKEPQ
jgi:hypothetical protein